MHARILIAVAVPLFVAGCASSFSASDRAAVNRAAGPPQQVAVRVIAQPADTLRYADADMAAVLAQMAALGAKPFETLTPQQARVQPTPADAVKAVLAARGQSTAPQPVGGTRDIAIPTPAGPVAARVYVPSTAASPTAAPPVIVYWHGGGWVVADLDTYDATPRALANGTGAIVVSAHYRQAPEHKFPAAHDDAWSVYQWVLGNAAALGGDRNRIIVVGESAGGNLAANVAIRARDSGTQAPLHMLLIYPIAGGSIDTPSYLENRGAAPLGRLGMNWFFEHSLASPQQRQDPRINLLGANLRGLPTATIITAEIDPLRWEGQSLAVRLLDAGGAVDSRTFMGVTHEFFGMAPVVADAVAAQDYANQRLRAALAPRLAAR